MNTKNTKNLSISAALLCSVLAIGPAAPAWGAPVPAWTTQLGTSGDDCANGVAVDSSGNVYIAGYTYGSLGGANPGGKEAFLAKYSSTGSLTWITQFGSSGNDGATGVAVDSTGNVYITGNTFLAKYSSAGDLAWNTQLPGTDSAAGVAVDSAGNVYITGLTNTSIPYYPQHEFAFLAKYQQQATWPGRT